MPQLTKNDLIRFDAQLRQLQADLTTTIRERLHQAGATEMALPNHFSDVREQAVADLLGDTELVQLQIELAELHDIDEALERIGAGTYGYCAQCAARISQRRLQAQPAARRCLSCQEALEKHRQPPAR